MVINGLVLLISAIKQALLFISVRCILAARNSTIPGLNYFRFRYGLVAVVQMGQDPPEVRNFNSVIFAHGHKSWNSLHNFCPEFYLNLQSG